MSCVEIGIELRKTMKADKNVEDPISRTRLKRKVLERWENEGGKIRTDPGTMPQTGTPVKHRRQIPSPSHDSLTKREDSSSSPNRQAKKN